MADLKISQLSAATALAGTEVVPVVQGGTTKKATIDQILAPAAGKGLDFSANAGTAGMTSELLDWYEEGTWTPIDASGAGLTLIVSNAFYTRIGRQVTVSAQVTYPTTADPSAASIGGLPFAANAGGNFSGSIENNAGLGAAYLLFGGSSALLVKQSTSILGALSNANLSTALVLVTATYIV